MKRPAAPPRRRKWRRILLVLGGLVLLLSPFWGTLALMLYNRHRGEQDLAEAVAAADQQDPQWRLADIEKRRAAVLDEDNAARPILDAVKLVPDNWPPSEVFEGIDILPPYQLDAATTQKIRDEMKLIQPALAPVRRAMALQKGWVPVKWNADYISTNFDHVQKLRRVGALLQLDAALHCQDGDYEGAWQLSLNQIAVCRAIGDEPTMISQLVRMAIRSLMLSCLERTLAQGTVDDAALAEGQRILLQEAGEPLLLYGLRGERGLIDMLLTNLENGTINESKTLAELRMSAPDEIRFWFNGGTYKHDQAWLLTNYTKAIDIAGGPDWEILGRLKDLEPEKNAMPPLAGMLVAANRKVAEAYLRSKSQLECARAALGVERFRLQNKRWPDSLEEVVAAKLLDKVPTDVFDGRPLRYRKWDQGMVVYSVGLDKTYKGDVLDGIAAVEADRIRYEFRLWDPEHRRQAPRPRPKADDQLPGDGKN